MMSPFISMWTMACSVLGIRTSNFSTGRSASTVAEVIWHLGPLRGVDQVEMETLIWVDWFNNRRLLEPIGDIPPREFEEAWYTRQAGAATEAVLK